MDAVWTEVTFPAVKIVGTRSFRGLAKGKAAGPVLVSIRLAARM